MRWLKLFWYPPGPPAAGEAAATGEALGAAAGVAEALALASVAGVAEALALASALALGLGEASCARTRGTCSNNAVEQTATRVFLIVISCLGWFLILEQAPN
jgi:hypothetical protein